MRLALVLFGFAVPAVAADDLVKNACLRKAICKGTQVGIDVNGSMSLVAVVTTLNGDAFLHRFGGTVVKNGSDAKTFLQMDASAPAACPPTSAAAFPAVGTVGIVGDVHATSDSDSSGGWSFHEISAATLPRITSADSSSRDVGRELRPQLDGARWSSESAEARRRPRTAGSGVGEIAWA